MLTHTDIHYLVGLFTLVAEENGVDVELGSMIYDAAAEKKRDVDITVRKKDGGILSVKGIEVKDEGKNLSVDTVEGLCIKLDDMPEITEKVIVSSKGFSSGAIKKAKAHGVKLLCLVDMDESHSLPHLTFSPKLSMQILEPKWEEPPHFEIFTTKPEDIELIKNEPIEQFKLCDKNGVSLKPEKTLMNAVNVSVQVMNYKLGEADPVLVPVNHLFPLNEELYVLFKGKVISFNRVGVRGILTYQVKNVDSKCCKVLIDQETNDLYVLAAVFELESGNLIGLVGNNSNRNIDLINIPSNDRLKGRISSPQKLSKQGKTSKGTRPS